MTVADEIFEIFEKRGAGAYFGEPVSQLEHALQAAHFAAEERAPEELIAAALLHDLGHLIEDLPEDIAEHGIDARHEEIGQAWLEQRFAAGVCEAVLLHVAAKRYLCATEPAYLETLSPASVLSLRLQGGPMSSEEVETFERNPYFKSAVRLRKWDDRAKVEGLQTESLASYRSLLDSQAMQSRVL